MHRTSSIDRRGIWLPEMFRAINTSRNPLRTSLITRLLLVLALWTVSAIGFSTPAASQVVGDNAPPSHVELVDDMGIDMSTARRTDIDGEVSIGSAESPTFKYSVGARQAYGTPLWGYAYLICSQGGQSCGPFYTFDLDTKSEWVRSSGYNYLSDGSQLEYLSGGGFRIYDKNGDIWTLSTLASGGSITNPPTRVAYLTSLKHPDGEELTYVYGALPQGQASYSNDTILPPTASSIISNRGYQLKLFYNPDKSVSQVLLINRQFFYCADLATSCSGAGSSWPSVTYAYQGTGRTINFSGSRTVTYSASQDQSTGAGIITTQTVTSSSGNYKTYSGRNNYNYSPSLAGGAYCDNSFKVQKIVSPVGTWNYQFSAGACPATYTVTKPSGATLSRSETGLGLSSKTDELGRVSHFAVSLESWPVSPYTVQYMNLTNVTLPEGNQTNFVYDSRKNVISTTQAAKPGSGVANRSWTAAYPASCSFTTAVTCNKPTYTIDPNGGRTDFTYDPAHGGVLTKTLPPDAGGIRPQERYTYRQQSARILDATGNIVSGAPIWVLATKSICISQSSCGGTAAEVVETYSYDDNLLLASVTRGTGDGSLASTVGYRYDFVGNLIATDGPRTGADDATYYFYDQLRRRVGQIFPDPDGAGPLPRPASRWSYNDDGKLLRTEQGSTLGVTQSDLAMMVVFKTQASSYDLGGRKIKDVTSASGVTYQVIQYSYDLDGHIACSALRMNPVTFSSPPASACTLGTTGTQGADRITKNVYDAAGQILKVQKAYGTSLQQDYATFSYSDNGKQTSLTDANGNKASMIYDGFDRQSYWYLPSPTTPGTVSATDYEAYTYDANDNRLSRRKRDGSVVSYSYDPLNRLTRKLVPDGCAPLQIGTCPSATATRDVYYGYDLRGLQLFARFDSASGSGVTQTYDGLSQLVTAASNTDGVARILSYQHDVDGNRTRVTYPDGNYFTTTYDGLNRPVAILENGAAQVVSVTYDAQGRRANETRAGVTTGYTFDPVSRLTVITDNLAGTLSDISSTLAYNSANQIATKTQSNDAYAYLGYATANTGYVSNGLNQYTAIGAGALSYDANGNVHASGTATYSYDAENRLIGASGGVTLDYDPLGRLWHMTTTTDAVSFLSDGDQLVEERDGSGALMRRYVHGYGADDPLLWYEGSGLSDRRSLQADNQGSIVSIADALGNSIGINSYDEYGVPGAANTGRFQYTAQAYLPALGFYYYKARMYSPHLGRFMQTDPIGYRDQNNLYAYVGNDPMDNRDPTGESELNLLARDEPLHDRENAVDFPNAFTIGSHGGVNGAVDHRETHQVVSPEELLREAENNHGQNYQTGGLTFLTGCNLASLTPHYPGAYQHVSFAQQYADDSRGNVIASTGVNYVGIAPSGDVVIKTDGEFTLSHPNGKTSTILGNTIVYSKKTDTAVILQDSTKTYSCTGAQCRKYMPSQ